MIVAAADLIGDQDQRRLSAATIINRAGASAREFHAAFHTLEDCLLAAFDEGLARLTTTITQAIAGRATMLARIDAGLDALLGFLEEEPGWGRLLLLELPAHAQPRRQRAIDTLARHLSDISLWSAHDPDPPPSEPQAARLAAEVLSVIATNMRAGKRQPLPTLAPWLMSMLIEPRLAWRHPGQAHERQLSSRHLSALHAGEGAGTPRTARTARMLRAVARNPGANNRQIAQAAGTPNDSNISRQLRLLQQRGLICNLVADSGRGQANAWRLTKAGEAAIQTGAQAGAGGRRAA